MKLNLNKQDLRHYNPIYSALERNHNNIAMGGSYVLINSQGYRVKWTAEIKITCAQIFGLENIKVTLNKS